MKVHPPLHTLQEGKKKIPCSLHYIIYRNRTSSESTTPPASPANMRKPNNYAWLPKDTTATMVRFSIIGIFQMYFEILLLASQLKLSP